MFRLSCKSYRIGSLRHLIAFAVTHLRVIIISSPKSGRHHCSSLTFVSTLVSFAARSPPDSPLCALAYSPSVSEVGSLEVVTALLSR